MLVISKALAWVTFHLPHTRPLLEGQAVELVRDERYVHENIREELISKDEILAEAKQAGIDRIEDIGSFVIEVDGTPSITQRGDSPELRAIKDLGERFQTLERQIGVSVEDREGDSSRFIKKAGDQADAAETKTAPPESTAHEHNRERRR